MISDTSWGGGNVTKRHMSKCHVTFCKDYPFFSWIDLCLDGKNPISEYIKF